MFNLGRRGSSGGFLKSNVSSSGAVRCSSKRRTAGTFWRYLRTACTWMGSLAKPRSIGLLGLSGAFRVGADHKPGPLTLAQATQAHKAVEGPCPGRQQGEVD